MGTLSEVWGQVKSLISDGISIIPVRDRDEKTKTGEVFVAKSPYSKWKEFQQRHVSEDELWMMMEEKDTTAIAIICGQISGNMEVIDIDVKYKPGIDAILMNDIRTFYPDLFSRLRIHKTPSGGYHIIYRVSGQAVPGNLKLAGRLATDDELAAQRARGVKRPNKEVNFLETRGEGGYILAPPSLGYALHKDNPIPLISWEERCSLIRLCETYHEIVREAPKFKPNKTQESIYDENPFEHFNREKDPTELIESFGWKYSHENARFIWYTRPDKQRGVSASWNKEKQIYYVFTSSTELQANKGYHPSTLLAELMFDGDKSKTYHYLTQNGYGKVKKKVEQGLVKKSVMAGTGIPANFSDDAKRTFEQLKITIHEDHPYGIFWETDEKDKIVISREGIYHVSNSLGFRIHHGDIYQIRENFIYDIEEREWMDALKAYIREEDANLYEDICNAYEAFMQRAGSFTLTRLAPLETDQVMNDTRDTCNKFFLNGYLTITATKCTFSTYDQLDRLVFYKRIQQRDFIKGKGGLYEEYLRLAVGLDDHLKSVIGFYAHEYKDASTGYFVVLTETCKNPEDGGGSGKNIFCELLRQTTTYIGRAASQSKLDEKIFQAWNGHRVFGISDTPEGFDFSFFKELITGTGVLKKLYRDERVIPVEEMPKFIAQTNYSVVCSDGGLKRRMIMIEFTDFFTNAGGVDVHFDGKLFPMDWTEADWAGYDNIIIESVQQYLKQGRKLKQKELSEDGWIKRFKLQYGQVAAGFVISNFDLIVKDRQITNTDLKALLINYYSENDIPLGRRPSAHKISSALNDYAIKHGLEVQADKTIRVNPMETCKGRIFVPIEPPF